MLALSFSLALAINCQSQKQTSLFGILDMPSSARSSAMGGTNVGLADRDVTMAADNPALMDSVAIGDFFLQYSPFLGGINLLNVGGAFSIGNAGLFGAGLSYLNYGEFQRTDDIGNDLGTFSPQDYCLRITKSHRLGPFSLGANVKYLFTSIDGHSASAVAADLGGVFIHPRADFSFGVLVKNLGATLTFWQGSNPGLPLDLQVGASFKPRYMPARFSLNLSKLNRDLGYFDNFPADGIEVNGADVFFRHLSVGMQLYIGKALTAMIGYNHLRNQELRLTQGNFGAGFSFGFELKIKKLQIIFSRATYHAAGGLTSFGVRGNLSGIRKIF